MRDASVSGELVRTRLELAQSAADLTQSRADLTDSRSDPTDSRARLAQSRVDLVAATELADDLREALGASREMGMAMGILRIRPPDAPSVGHTGCVLPASHPKGSAAVRSCPSIRRHVPIQEACRSPGR